MFNSTNILEFSKAIVFGDEDKYLHDYKTKKVTTIMEKVSENILAKKQFGKLQCTVYA
jgi:hypothetical protein